MSKFLRKMFFWAVIIALFLGIVVFINNEIEKKRSEKSENNPQQKNPEMPNDDNPEYDPETTMPPIDTENWWLTDEEIEYAYSEMRKKLDSSPKIQLVSPSVVRFIQEGGEISEDLKKAEYIFFPINNSESHETGDSGSHWTLLVYAGGELGAFFNYNSLEFSVTPENAMKVAKNFHKKAGLTTLLKVENVEEIPRQTNNADCGVYVIAYTRALIKKYKEKQAEGEIGISLNEKDLIFPTAEERQKLRKAGFPKKGTPGKDYEIGDDVDYRESEEELISQWWPKPDNPFHPLRIYVRTAWNLDIEKKGSPYDHVDNFKEFSKKVRLLSGKSEIEKAKLSQIYRIKKILKACSLPLEEYKKTKSFNGKDNFSAVEISSEEGQFVKDNINRETVREINDLYKTHFPGK